MITSGTFDQINAKLVQIRKMKKSKGWVEKDKELVQEEYLVIKDRYLEK